MAAVITIATQQAEIQGRRTKGSMTLGTAYATGGVAITPQELALGLIGHLSLNPSPNGTDYFYEPVTAKIFARNALGELPNGLDISAAGYLSQWEASGPY